MYDDTITLFNRYSSRKLGDTWFPTILENVSVNIDRAQIVATQGSDSKDNARIHIKYTKQDGEIVVGGKRYLTPKAWASQLTDELSESVTFKSGNQFDFIMVGAWDNTEPIKDDDYTEGFYNYMNSTHDNVFVITSASSPYKAIPHFELLAR